MVIEHLEKALDKDLWVDDTHLDENGLKVFNEEKKAVKELMYLLDKDGTPQDIKNAWKHAQKAKRDLTPRDAMGL